MSVHGEASHTAIVVIHGIGEQNPFDTLDDFARHLAEEYGAQGYAVQPLHLFAQRKGNGGEWTEHYIRLALAKDGAERLVDLHEYYWAHKTEEKISLAEVVEWMKRAVAEAAEDSAIPPELVKKYGEHGGLCFKEIALPLKLLIWASRFRWLLPVFIRNFLEKLFSFFARYTGYYIVGYVGDVAIYTTMDEKSRHYGVRQDILAGGMELMEGVLADGCQKVVVAGHSLGSVIAYDLLNRLNIRSHAVSLPLGKIAGLVTFGSPLDKIAYVFNEKVGKEQWIKGQIIEHLHSFKTHPLLKDRYRPVVKSPFTARLDDVTWLNYYIKQDKVSDFLVFYDIPEGNNCPLAFEGDNPINAHLDYWSNRAFYRDFMKKLAL